MPPSTPGYTQLSEDPANDFPDIPSGVAIAALPLDDGGYYLDAKSHNTSGDRFNHGPSSSTAPTSVRGSFDPTGTSEAGSASRRRAGKMASNGHQVFVKPGGALASSSSSSSSASTSTSSSPSYEEIHTTNTDASSSVIVERAGVGDRGFLVVDESPLKKTGGGRDKRRRRKRAPAAAVGGAAATEVGEGNPAALFLSGGRNAINASEDEENSSVCGNPFVVSPSLQEHDSDAGGRSSGGGGVSSRASVSASVQQTAEPAGVGPYFANGKRQGFQQLSQRNDNGDVNGNRLEFHNTGKGKGRFGKDGGGGGGGGGAGQQHDLGQALRTIMSNRVVQVLLAASSARMIATWSMASYIAVSRKLLLLVMLVLFCWWSCCSLFFAGGRVARSFFVGGGGVALLPAAIITTVVAAVAVLALAGTAHTCCRCYRWVSFWTKSCWTEYSVTF